MLKSIYCDKFTEKTIHFKGGLNAVIGDDNAANSIGKSNMLMIIDFVFGGNTFITHNMDAVEALGALEFNFEFVFDKSYYFKRCTSNYKFVSICDAEFKIIKNITVNEYCEFLKERYGISIPDISFRNIVGRYARVYGKENLNEKRPLQYVARLKDKENIISLIQLFEKYTIISDLEQQLNSLESERSALKNAAKHELIPKMTKAGYVKNTKSIDALKKELKEIKDNIIDLSTDIEAKISKEVLTLRRRKSDLIIKKNIYANQLNRTKHNIGSTPENLEVEMMSLLELFPNINIERVKKIKSFHQNITKILQSEFESSAKDLEDRIMTIEGEIAELDKRINQSLNIKDAPNYNIARVVDISAAVAELEHEKNYYIKMVDLDESTGKAKSDLAEIKSRILSEIQNQINIKMNDLNCIIYENSRKSPAIELSENKYQFYTYGDTGTGTAYANLITFDLALLMLTCLPTITHDTPVFKNIEDRAMAKIIQLYTTFDKQIFIAIDKIHSYDESVVTALEKNEVLKLSADKTLFIKNWKQPFSL